MAAPLARMAMCARSLRLGSEGSVGKAANSACVTALAGGSTCKQSNQHAGQWMQPNRHRAFNPPQRLMSG